MNRCIGEDFFFSLLWLFVYLFFLKIFFTGAAMMKEAMVPTPGFQPIPKVLVVGVGVGGSRCGGGVVMI